MKHWLLLLGFLWLASCNPDKNKLILLIDTNIYNDTTRFIVWVENNKIYNDVVFTPQVEPGYFTRKYHNLPKKDSLHIKIGVPQYGIAKDTVLQFTPENRVLSVYLTKEIDGTIDLEDFTLKDSVIRYVLSAGFISEKHIENPF